MTVDRIPALLEPIQNRLSRAEDSAVTCQGDGLDKDYINALEVVSVDSARLLAAVQAVERTAKNLDRLADGDRHYANLFRKAVIEALGGEA